MEVVKNKRFFWGAQHDSRGYQVFKSEMTSDPTSNTIYVNLQKEAIKYYLGLTNCNSGYTVSETYNMIEKG